MIVVAVQNWPDGARTSRQTLVLVGIVQTRTEDDAADYAAVIIDGDRTPRGAIVTGHPHSHGTLSLVESTLAARGRLFDIPSDVAQGILDRLMGGIDT